MSYESFWRLHLKLATRINSARLAARRYVLKGGRKGGRFKSPPIRNGRISTSVRLACALRKFRIEYPSSVDEQRRIAADFERKPSLREAKCVGVDQMNFFAAERASLGSTVKPLAMSMAEFLT
ncbi:hypothetical protein ACHAW5_007061 [Stephanodiscus triporus]|uniref:Uncharacterized protein n=1 Tax=Stephanodiscus triporus TaxID=2934178 RepID=A0ABD3PVD8_9STRA